MVLMGGVTMRIIASINQKGGVAKTTSALNLGAGIAMLEKEKKVIVLDLDPQCSLTLLLGYDPIDFETSITDVLNQTASIKNIIYKSGLLDNLFIIPASPFLAAAEKNIEKERNGYLYLQDVLSDIQDEFDYVIIDCPPRLDLLTISALAAATDYIVPCTAEYLAYQGLIQLKQTVAEVQELTNRNIKDLGVIVTRFNGRRKNEQEILAALKDAYYVVGIIKDTTIIDAGLRVGKPVVAAAPKTAIAKEYMRIAQHIINNQC